MLSGRSDLGQLSISILFLAPETMIDEELQKRIQALHASGKSFRVIGEELGMSACKARYIANPARRLQAKRRATMINSLARKFYWWCKRNHPDFLNSFVDTL